MPDPMRYTPAEHDAFARDFDRDSPVILRDHIPRARLARWAEAFPPLFPEWKNNDTPSFQLAVNFALCDVGDDNGPFETTYGTHRMNREEAMTGLASGAIAQHRLPMRMGDVMIRDVRAVHRGTPNRTDRPRPMVVIGYSRRWYYRPEVHIRVPQSVWDGLSPIGRSLLRYNPVVPDDALAAGEETYRSFAY